MSPLRTTSIALTLALGAPTAAADVVTLVADRDNTLYQDPAGGLSNGAGEYFFAGLNQSANVRRALLRFDLAAAVPAGSTVESVRLFLDMSQTSGGPVGVSLHALLADWGEAGSDAPGAEGGGAPPEAGDATWLHTFHPGLFWSIAGGDFDPLASATRVVDQPDGYAWESTPELVADAQGWVDDPSSNFGWLIKEDGESSVGSAKRFATRENAAPGSRPLLEIGFVPPGGCSGVAYCSANPNSTGFGARMFQAGDCSIAAGDLRLVARPVPDEVAIFFRGDQRSQIAFGDGFLCARSALRRLGPPLLATGNEARASFDPAALGLAPGTTAFQCWFRDPAAGGAGFNTSDGLEIVLLP